jgi:predicted HTH domain antitoxin
VVTVHLDDALAEAMRLTDEPLDRLARKSIVLELYRRKTISSGKAAALLEMPRFDFVRYASSLGIPFFDMTPEEWDAEVRTIEAIRSS